MKIDFLKAVLIIVVVAAPFTASMAEPLSLGDAVKMAVEYSPYLKSFSSVVDHAHEQLGEARSMKGAKLGISVAKTRTDSPLGAFGTRLSQGRVTPSDFNPSRLNDPDFLSNRQIAGQIAIPLYLGDADSHSIRAARSGIEAAKHEREATREDVIYQAIEAYLMVILSTEMVQTAVRACESSKESIRNAQAAIDSMRAVQSDLLQARVHHSRNEETLLRMNNQASLANDTLATLLGVENHSQFELNMPFMELVCTLCDDDPQELLEIALAQRSDYLELHARLLSAREMEKAQLGMLKPHVSVGAALESNSRAFGSAGKSNSTVFARIDWNISDGGRLRHAAKGFARQAERLKHLTDALKDKIFLDIRAAVKSINNALERVRVSSEAIEQSRESLRILRNRYQAGLAIMSDLLDMEASLQNHEMNHLSALFDYAMSRVRLRKAMGDLTLERCAILDVAYEQP